MVRLLNFFAKPQPQLDGEIAVADSRFVWASGLSGTYNPNDLIGRKGLDVIDKMRVDDQVKAAMAFKKHAILATGWTVESPEGQPEDWEVTRFVNYCLQNLVGTLEADLIEILSAMDYGFSLTEKIYSPVEAGEWRGKLCLKELKTRRPHDFRLFIDKFGNLTEINQYQGTNGYVSLPPAKFIIYSYDQEFGNWYGRTDLEAAYRAWWSKDNAYKWMAMFLERRGIPPIVAKYDHGLYSPALQEKLKKFLERLQSATFGILPMSGKDSLELWTPQMGDQVKAVFVESIDMYNKDIARALLMPGMLGLTPDEGGGSHARANVHFDSFMLVIEKVRKADIQEKVVNTQIIKQLVDLNYSVDQYPVFKLLPLTKEIALDLLSTWTQMITTGAVNKQASDEQHIREMMEFPDVDETDRLDPPVDPSKDPNQVPSQPINEQQKQYALSRKANKYERKIDFKQVSQDLDAIEAEAIKSLKAGISEVFADLIKQASRAYETNPISFVKDLQLRKTKTIEAALGTLIDTAYNSGGDHATTEVKSFKVPGVVPKAAVAYLAAKKVTAAGILITDLLNDVKQTLLTSIRSGSGTRDAIDRLNQLQNKYIGNDSVLKDGEPLSANRLETIVRTNTTEAYNQGRVVRMRQSQDVQYIEYSAIMDSRTTEVCAHLDGKLFRRDDPALDSLIPPNHYNCRSVLVPVTISETVNEAEIISNSEIGEAKSLAGKGFV